MDSTFVLLLNDEQKTELDKLSGLFIDKVKVCLERNYQGRWYCTLSRQDFHMCLVEIKMKYPNSKELINRMFELGESQDQEFKQEIDFKLSVVKSPW